METGLACGVRASSGLLNLPYLGMETWIASECKSYLQGLNLPYLGMETGAESVRAYRRGNSIFLI